MYHLRNVINRTKSTNLVHSHVVETANILQGEEPTTKLSDLAAAVIDRFVRLPDPQSTTACKECEDQVYLNAMIF